MFIYNVITVKKRNTTGKAESPKSFKPYTCDQATMSSGIVRKMLEARAEKIREEIKAEMKVKGESEIHTGNFIVRLKEVITNRFDSKSFREEHKRRL